MSESNYRFRLTERDRLRHHEMDRLEANYREQGYQLIAGVDEAGRGPLAGPVYCAACILNPKKPILGLNDSKKISEKRRLYLFEKIKEDALTYTITARSVEEIDRLNILEATKRGMREAILQLKPKPDLVLLDAVQLSDERMPPQRSIIGGDAQANSIAAASILAKVSRDLAMREAANKYPEYGFERHKGYGTAAHYAALAAVGPCPIHRLSFLHKLSLGEQVGRANPKGAGALAEQQVAVHLKRQGYHIVEQNFWLRPFGEIDLIACKQNTWYFIEVKARRGDQFLEQATEALDPQKVKTIRRLAEYYIHSRKIDARRSIILLAACHLSPQQTVDRIQFCDLDDVSS